MAKKKKGRGFKKALRGLPKDVKQQILAEIRLQRQISRGKGLGKKDKEILDQARGLTSSGQEVAQSYVDNHQQFGPEDFGEYRGQIEDAVFGRLTQGLDQDYQTSRQSKEQELLNKGIPYSADPNSRFQQELNDIDRRYDEARLQARNQAAITGGDEMVKQFGVERGTAQQQLGEAAAIQQFGSGVPSTQYQPTSPIDAYNALEQLRQRDKQLGIQQQQVGIQAQAANNAANAAAGNNGPFNN